MPPAELQSSRMRSHDQRVVGIATAALNLWTDQDPDITSRELLT